MGYEIDYFRSLTSNQSHTAMALRFGDIQGPREKQFIMVVDAGYKETGQQIIDHIKNAYNTSVIDLAVLTHMDDDHALGFLPILDPNNGLEINTFACLFPWLNNNITQFNGDSLKRQILEQFIFSEYLIFKAILKDSRDEYIIRSANTLKNIFDAISNNGIQLIQPYTDIDTNLSNNFPGLNIYTLSPSYDYYHSLFKNDKLLLSSLNLERIGKKDTQEEKWDEELLEDPGKYDTSNFNESSIVLLITYENNKLFFTGDIGVRGFEESFKTINKKSIDIANLKHFQVPHHGSDHNIGPTILNILFGEPREQSYQSGVEACIPASVKDGLPVKAVYNALIRRGVKVFWTKKENSCFSFNTEPRNDPIQIHFNEILID